MNSAHMGPIPVAFYRAKSAVTENLGESENERPVHRISLSGRKILVVDDCPQMRAQICELIKRPGDVIYECFDGDIAVGSYARLQPELVLMDIEIEGMDGIQATREICRQDPKASVVIVSQHSSTAFKEAALEAGASGYVIKEELEKLPQVIKGLSL
jgi:two-component system, chemotaxis family, chemotaxis protein CheY